MNERDDYLNQLVQAEASAREALLAERQAGGWWEGELSRSALATAVAVLALASGPDAAQDAALIRGGLDWLFRTQDDGGGWGDTVQSRANVATTLLAWAALGLGAKWSAAAASEQDSSDSLKLLFQDRLAAAARRAEAWILQEAGGLEPARLKAALAKRYGKDRTFAVPILMACAVGGRLGAAPACWREVPALPFELAAFPRRWFAALRLPVVSYALPALIAIGQVRHAQAPARGPLRWLRQAAVGRTKRLLREIQPQGGGFLEAVPLTGFVIMALAAAGSGQDAVVAEAAAFLRQAVRPDGSWPIDSNLATWGTTLAVKALGPDMPPAALPPVLKWLLAQQYQVLHPYCLSPPGGWAWTDLPGGVPDADDTAGALLALDVLSDSGAEKPVAPAVLSAAAAGAHWLAQLQNRDGGIPTFCKGWGALPFDRSAPDLTAHALAAWQAWRVRADLAVLPAMRRAVTWLAATQRADGAWLPLWFGNEAEPDEANPVYGTATVLKYLCRLPLTDFSGQDLAGMRRRAGRFLTESQRPADGTWSGGSGGGPASIEESAAALEALLALHPLEPDVVPEPLLERGLTGLLALTCGGTTFPAAPIGLYFARLWYDEKLYPVISAVAALRAARGWLMGTAGRPATVSSGPSRSVSSSDFPPP